MLMGLFLNFRIQVRYKKKKYPVTDNYFLRFYIFSKMYRIVISMFDHISANAFSNKYNGPKIHPFGAKTSRLVSSKVAGPCNCLELYQFS